MIFVELSSMNFPIGGGKHYFVADSLEAVMEDTLGGTQFGFITFNGHKIVSEKEVELMRLLLWDDGVTRIKDGASCFYLGASVY